MSRAFRFTPRTKARKCAADVVFEADQRGMGRDLEVLHNLLRQRRVITAVETLPLECSTQIIEGVANSLRCIDDLVAARAKVSGLDRIAVADLTVICVAVWEILENSEDVSAIIATDEVTSIVKFLSADAASSFVNVVLDTIRKDLEASAWTCREASVVKDEPALDSEDGPAFDFENEDEGPTEEHDDAEDAPLSPEFAEPGEEGPTGGLNDEELAELDEPPDEYWPAYMPGMADHKGGSP